MATLSAIQNKILEKENLLISVKARLLYPHIGGYTARPYDPDTGTLEPPRPTEIKALWRWWARSLLSGAYGGTEDYKFLDKEIGKILGRTEETPQTSLFHLSVTAINYSDLKQQFSIYYNYLKRKYLNNERDLQNLIKDFFTRKHNITRLFLVSLGAQREQKISEVAVVDKYNNLHITIDLFLTFPFTRQRYPLNMLRFALWSFFVSLILGSIGYGSRRGLGSIIVQEIKENPDLLKYYPELGTDLARFKEIIATLNNGDCEKIEKKLDELVKQAYEVAKGFKENFNKDSSHIVNPTSFPEVPSVIPNGDVFKMKVYQCSDPLIALQCISKSTLKNEWLKVVGSSVGQPVYRSQLHTWILGLPRSSRGKGYYLATGSKKDPGRRVSAIQFKLWQNKNKTFVIVFGFLSKDWKIDTLNHFTRSKTPVSREDVVYADGHRFTPQNNNELLSKAFEAAWSFISEILNRCCSGGKNG